MNIAISGAGVAGPALAYWLHRIGHTPTIVETAPQFRTGGYVIDFWGLGYTIAERMGVLPQVRAAGYQVQELRLLNARGRRVGGMNVEPFRRITNGRFTSLPRGDLADAVYQAIEGQVETLFDNSITALDEHETGVRVSLRNGPQREFDLVVGADGLHSNVRRLAFGPSEQFVKRLGYYVAAVEVADYHPREELVYVAFTEPKRQVARFSLRKDRTLFLFVFAEELLPGGVPRETTEQKASLRRVFGDAGWECPQILAATDGVDDVYFDSVDQIILEPWSRGRVVLIGDAAACVSLLAGEGTGLAMIEAYVLAGELQRAGGDYVLALVNYESRLRGFIRGKQKSAESFAKFFAPKNRRQLWLRNEATKLLGLPWIGARLLSASVRDDLELPDYGI